jgi:nitrogen fixation protein NifQ
MRLKQVDKEPIQLEYERIMSHAAGESNHEALASMLASCQAGIGVMPDRLGLAQPEFTALMDLLFPGLTLDSFDQTGRQADQNRTDEYHDVLKLLQDNRAHSCHSEKAMAMIVSQACQGQDHLWQDMGLWSRDQLSALMLRNFPSLAQRNTQNMKWKKFIYKQLCNAEGIYTCLAPSCEVCVDYDACFGPED